MVSGSEQARLTGSSRPERPSPCGSGAARVSNALMSVAVFLGVLPGGRFLFEEEPRRSDGGIAMSVIERPRSCDVPDDDVVCQTML